ncbi:MAG TPA: hypothetical protein QGF02_04355 [Candidatus Babeliales bacterium]|nr:hypothetical protein [Candidatus Babeliales bacterium]
MKKLLLFLGLCVLGSSLYALPPTDVSFIVLMQGPMKDATAVTNSMAATQG